MPDRQSSLDMGGIEARQTAAAQMREELNAMAVAEREQIEAYRTAILDGGSSGDPLVDLVVVRNRELDTETVELYRDLSARVSAHVREPVMVVVHDEKRLTFGGPGRRERSMIREHIAVGILTSDSLEVDAQEGDWAFPTNRYVKSDSHSPAKHILVKGGLRTNCFGIGHHDFPPFEKVHGEPLRTQFDWQRTAYGERAPVELEVMVGDGEIDAWLEKKAGPLRHQRPYAVYNKMARPLGAGIKKPKPRR